MSPRRQPRRANAVQQLARLTVLTVPLTLAAPAARAADGPPPASAPAAMAARKVLVLSFTVDGDKETTVANGLGRSLGQSIAADVTAGGSLRADYNGGTVANADEAVTAARQAGARYAVFGNVYQVGGNVRVLGQVLDAQTGQPVSALKATGGTNDFFQLQDAVGRRVLAAVGGGTAGTPLAGYGEVAGRQAETRGESHWGAFADRYDPPAALPATGQPPYPPPVAPPPPLYGGYYGGYGYNGGGYYGGGGYYPVAPGFPAGLGTVRTETFRSFGHSIIVPSTIDARPINSYLPGVRGPARLPQAVIDRPRIQDYVNPYARFPSTAGQPQRAAPPILRPGAPTAPAGGGAQPLRAK